MTTRAQLESERDALRNASIRLDGRYQQDLHAALTASIARVEALLSLSDNDADRATVAIMAAARTEERAVRREALDANRERVRGNYDGAEACESRSMRRESTRAALRTVAEIVRRS